MRDMTATGRCADQHLCVRIRHRRSVVQSISGVIACEALHLRPASPAHMATLCRYPPQPRHPPFAFYSAVRLGDPDQLALIMATDPYFVTQDNGAGAPLHFATTYKQLDMVRLCCLLPSVRPCCVSAPGLM
jgi:hypothetical protein